MERKMPVIRVSQRIWDRMKQHAQPFEDSPNDIIDRALDALDLIRNSSTTSQKHRSIKSKSAKTMNEIIGKSKIDHQEFRVPILETLRELGGKARPRSVRERLEPKLVELFGSRVTKAELAPVSNSQPRWWNAASWERKYLVNDGLLKGGSDRGVWELTEAGYKFLEN
jgi:hypothetical protein